MLHWKWNENQTFHTKRNSFQYHHKIINKSFLVDLSFLQDSILIFKDTRAVFPRSMFSTTRWNVDNALSNFQFLFKPHVIRKQKLPIFQSSWSNFLGWEFLYRAHELRVFLMKLSLVWRTPRMWSKAEIGGWKYDTNPLRFAVSFYVNPVFGRLKGVCDCLWSVSPTMNFHRAVSNI